MLKERNFCYFFNKHKKKYLLDINNYKISKTK